MNTRYFNGRYTEDTKLIDIRDCGFTTGIGVFDSLLVIDGVLQYGRDHFERLAHDCETVIGLPLPLSYDEFETIIRTLLKKNNCLKHFARVRSTVSGGIVAAPLIAAQELNILIDAIQIKAPDSTAPYPVCIIDEYPRIAGCHLENCKRLDYSRSYAARRAAETRGCTDAILTNTKGYIACGPTGNLFIEENGKLITPSLSEGVLAGVTRKNLIKEKPTSEEPITIERLKAADKIYLTNSFIGLREIELK